MYQHNVLDKKEGFMHNLGMYPDNKWDNKHRNCANHTPESHMSNPIHRFPLSWHQFQSFSSNLFACQKWGLIEESKIIMRSIVLVIL